MRTSMKRTGCDGPKHVGTHASQHDRDHHETSLFPSKLGKYKESIAYKNSSLALSRAVPSTHHALTTPVFHKGRPMRTIQAFLLSTLRAVPSTHHALTTPVFHKRRPMHTIKAFLLSSLPSRNFNAPRAHDSRLSQRVPHAYHPSFPP